MFPLARSFLWGAKSVSKIDSISAIGISTFRRPAPGSLRLISWSNQAEISQQELWCAYPIQ